MKAYPSEKIRSFVLAGHSHSGKTSLAEGILWLTGQSNRLASGAMDFEPEEQKRGGSLWSSFLTCEYDGFRIHVADTPGDGDFIHDARVCIPAYDAVMLVVSAVEGIEPQTERISAFAAELNRPQAIFINKLDSDRADWRAVVDDVADHLHLTPVLLQLPIGEGESFEGVIDLVTMRAFTYDGDSGKPIEGDIPDAMKAAADEAHEAMIEAIAATDDELIEQFLMEETLTIAEVRVGLYKGILSGAITPVLLGSAGKNIGIDRVLWLARAFPSPTERPPVTGTLLAGKQTAGDDEVITIAPGDDQPFTAICFKELIDPFVGAVALFRIFSGSVKVDDHLLNTANGRDERISQLHFLTGQEHTHVKEATAGDIVAMTKLRETHRGHTLTAPSPARRITQPDPPAPMIAFVLKPKTRGDEDRLRVALEKTRAEDPVLEQTFDPVTKEVVLSGMGSNHIAMTVERMGRRYNAHVDLGTPTIPYRETISGSADVRYRHKKQTGGAGQFGEVAIRISHNEEGGFLFENQTVGGVIPHTLIPSVEKGVRAQLEKGILAGFPVVDVKCVLYDGKSHPVDSKDIAFQIAGRYAIKEAVLKARPVLLEPVYDVNVVAPEAHVGDIMGDLNTRRARIKSMITKGRNNIVSAAVPLAEMLTYAPALKSMTAGQGTYTMKFAAFEPVPHSQQDELVAQVNRIKAGEDDDH